MRSVILSAVLGLGVLGFVGATPSVAKAQRINPVLMQGYQLNGYGYLNAYSRPAWMYTTSPWMSQYSYYTPAAYRTNFTPYGMSQYWATRGMVGWSYNPWWGLTYNTTTPAVWGYSYSPYYGYFRSVAVPSMTYSVPAGYILP
jgi:hypothetical protein